LRFVLNPTYAVVGWVNFYWSRINNVGRYIRIASFALTMQVDALRLRVDTLTMQVDALRLRVDTLTMQVDALRLRVDTLTMQVNNLGKRGEESLM